MPIVTNTRSFENESIGGIQGVLSFTQWHWHSILTTCAGLAWAKIPDLTFLDH